MAKTNVLRFKCEKFEATPNSQWDLMLKIESPELDDLLNEIEEDDLIGFVKDHFSPEDVFSTNQLDKWAESEGYTKEGKGSNE